MFSCMAENEGTGDQEQINWHSDSPRSVRDLEETQLHAAAGTALPLSAHAQSTDADLRLGCARASHGSSGRGISSHAAKESPFSNRLGKGSLESRSITTCLS